MTKSQFPKRDLNREREILSKPVRSDGVGEDPVVKAVMSENFVTGTNAEALDIALAIQHLIKGQASVLENMKTITDEVAKLREQYNKWDEDARKYNENREKFIQDINEKANKLRVTDPIEKANIKAKALELHKMAVAKARVVAATNRVALADQIAREPKEMIISPGKLETVMEGGYQVTRLVPEVLRIRGMRWVLSPGVPTKVPKFVAEVYRKKLQDRALESRQEELIRLGGNTDWTNDPKREMSYVQMKWNEIVTEMTNGDPESARL